ncbi:head maturation protease, ClpP-related [Nonomuraea sp. NPDC050643]|uniref:head maturation protease, ClpP-related n=1 Tax=Nonomuraea sp. NPDC050643 TaxID=3155660 RepID=UPI0033C39DC2
MRLKPDRAILARVHDLLAVRNSQPLPTGHVRPELAVTALAEGEGSELLLYDEIGFWGIWAVDVAAALSTVSGPLHVRINSPGGDVFDGVAIYNLIADYPDQVTVTVDGLAASAASFIAMAGDTIRMNRASQMMIHDASGGCRGNAADMKAMAALLDMISSTIASIYAGRAGGEVEEWRERMLVDGGFGTWYTAEEAVATGLADELVPLPSEPDEPTDGGQAAARAVAALFPYAMPGEDRWRLAARIPSEGSTDRSEGSTDRSEGSTDQAPAQSQPHPPAEHEPAPAPPTPEPAVEPAPEEPQPDAWASAVAHLTTPPSTEDVWDRLREALL